VRRVGGHQARLANGVDQALHGALEALGALALGLAVPLAAVELGLGFGELGLVVAAHGVGPQRCDHFFRAGVVVAALAVAVHHAADAHAPALRRQERLHQRGLVAEAVHREVDGVLGPLDALEQRLAELELARVEGSRASGGLVQDQAHAAAALGVRARLEGPSS
jgi:hypothetical protein